MSIMKYIDVRVWQWVLSSNRQNLEMLPHHGKTNSVYIEVYHLMARRCLNIDIYYNINITRGLLPDTAIWWWYFIYFTSTTRKYGISESHKGTADVGKIFFTLIPTTVEIYDIFRTHTNECFSHCGSKLSAFLFAMRKTRFFF